MPTRKCGENESIAETDTAGMTDYKRMKKGNTLLSKASPLKLLKSFCIIATYYTPQ